jgi:tetratricopeptide (TPR) repeat protein
MAGHKKPVTSSKKKKKSKNRQKAASSAAPPTIEDILQQADLAFETSNVETALQLYQYVASQLRNQVDSNSTSENDNCNQSIISSNAVLLAKVLSKIGEAKVSMGDPETARADFVDAITTLSSVEHYIPDPTTALNNTNNTTDGINKAQYKELLSNLFLYLGQLSSDHEALDCFKKAILSLTDCLQLLEQQQQRQNSIIGGKSDHKDDFNSEVQNTIIEIRRQLCRAHVSKAELYLTDLCYEPNAEQECESSLNAALLLDDPHSSPDALQAMASLRLSQEKHRRIESISYMLDTYARMKVGCEALADLVGLSLEDEQHEQFCNNEGVAKELQEEALSAVQSLPGFEFRCQTAKLFMECSSLLQEEISNATTATNTNDSSNITPNTQMSDSKLVEQKKFCIKAAIYVLGSLLAENDEVIEIWYLLGCAFHSATPPNHDASKYYWDNTLEMLEKVKESLGGSGICGEVAMKDDQDSDDDDDDDDNIQEQMEDIEQKIKDVKQKLSEIEGYFTMDLT